MKKLVITAMLLGAFTFSVTSCEEKTNKEKAMEKVEEMEENGAEVKIKDDKIKAESDDVEIKVKEDEGEIKIKEDNDS